MANTNKVTLDQLEMSMNVVKKYIDSVATSESIVVFENVTEGEIMTSVEEIISCTGITLSSNTLSLNGLTSQTLVATIEPSDCSEEVSWSVSPSGVVTVKDGIVTSVANGDCVITATCGSHSATCNVNVSGIVVLGNLVINKTSISIEEGASDTFEITLDSQPNTEQIVTISVDNDNSIVSSSNLTFTSDNYNVAQVVTVTATDNSDVGDTNSSVVTISSDGVSSKTINITVTDNDGVSCTGISLDQTSLSFTEDYSAQLTATTTPTDTTDTISWSVSPSGIVTVADGLVTPVANGDAVITVTCGNQSTTCSVNVSCFEESGEISANTFAYLDNGYINIKTNNQSAYGLATAVTGATDTDHIYYRFTGVAPSVITKCSVDTVVNYFGEAIPYYGTMNSADFIEGVEDAEDLCFAVQITSGSVGVVTIRLPIPDGGSSGDLMTDLSNIGIEVLPLLVTSEYTTYEVTDDMLNACTSISGTSDDGTYYKGFVSVPSSYQYGVNISAGMNSLSFTAATSGERWYVNVSGGRLNYQILNTKIEENTIDAIKSYLQENKLIFWV